jgi:hypothetical protein
MTSGFFALFLALSLPAFAVEKAGKYVLLKGKGGHEECLKLKKGQELHYSFHSKLPVVFNIRYQAGEGSEYPVKRGASRRQNARFEADADREYCLMWENQSIEKTRLNYSLKMGGRAEPSKKSQ